VINNRTEAAGRKRTSSGEVGDLRQRILDAALDIVAAGGIQALTQPKVAKAAGIRQSHITYYFPRKADLVVGLLEASHRRAAPRPRRRRDKSQLADAMSVVLDPVRMEFFLGILLAASADPELRDIVRTHADEFTRHVGGLLGRQSDDAALIAFIDEIRGAGLRRVMGDPRASDADVTAIARRHGLLDSRVHGVGGAGRRTRGAAS